MIYVIIFNIFIWGLIFWLGYKDKKNHKDFKNGTGKFAPKSGNKWQ